jgi:hypothetical protein
MMQKHITCSTFFVEADITSLPVVLILFECVNWKISKYFLISKLHLLKTKLKLSILFLASVILKLKNNYMCDQEEEILSLIT